MQNKNRFLKYLSVHKLICNPIYSLSAFLHELRVQHIFLWWFEWSYLIIGVDIIRIICFFSQIQKKAWQNYTNYYVSIVFIQQVEIESDLASSVHLSCLAINRKHFLCIFSVIFNKKSNYFIFVYLWEK